MPITHTHTHTHVSLRDRTERTHFALTFVLYRSQVRIRWQQEGDVVMYDNRCTQHYAVAGTVCMRACACLRVRQYLHRHGLS